MGDLKVPSRLDASFISVTVVVVSRRISDYYTILVQRTSRIVSGVDTSIVPIVTGLLTKQIVGGPSPVGTVRATTKQLDFVTPPGTSVSPVRTTVV